MRRTTDFRPFYTVDRGFTLVEMVIAIVIISVGLAGVLLADSEFRRERLIDRRIDGAGEGTLETMSLARLLEALYARTDVGAAP